jgi:hypothetical protein
MKRILGLILQHNGYYEQLHRYINSDVFMEEPFNQPECFPEEFRPLPPTTRFT